MTSLLQRFSSFVRDQMREALTSKPLVVRDRDLDHDREQFRISRCQLILGLMMLPKKSPIALS